MKKILLVIYKFIRALSRFFFILLLGLICKGIYFFNKEKGKEKQLTIKKAKRIRRLTNFKITMYKFFPFLMSFFGVDKYLKNLKEKIEYGM